MRLFVKKWRKGKKPDVVLTVSGILALISMLWNPPGMEYLEFIDIRVLCLLFSLMAVIEGLRQEGVFAKAAGFLTGKAGNLRVLSGILTGLCFFLSMFITNDVSLITFVPMTIFMLQGCRQKYLIRVIVLETIAANLGSMLLPFGNPQNLYLYGKYHMGFAAFVKTMFPVWILSLVLLILFLCLLIPAESLGDERGSVQNVHIAESKAQVSADTFTRGKHQRKILIYLLLFLAAISGVLRLVPYYAVLLLVTAVFLVLEPAVLKKVDYGLLLTFVFFFLFVGNLSELEIIRESVRRFLEGRVVLAGALTSQVISNVPAALMLSGFTEEGTKLLLGVNIGGLGTLIASMASLISYKYYKKTKDADGRQYFLCFTFLNVLMLGILLGAAALGSALG